MYTATYSPEDNKLRLYASARLDDETFAKIKAAGFRWAPKQELFVAPMWTPEREDVLVELAGEVGDEDTSLADRQEARAERFDALSEKRAADGNAAREASDKISERFYGGQPILVGHHSERRARKDQERMHGQMRKAVNMWETANYWASRAAGAIALAKYKERPDVRARRIKGIESNERKQLKYIAEREKLAKFWASNPSMEKAVQVANSFDHGGIRLDNGERHYSLWSALTDGKVSLQNVIGQRGRGLPLAIAHQQRWLAHYQNRLVYERAMLGESGGLVADKFELAVGGQVLVGGKWEIVLRLNKKAGKVVSLRTTRKYAPIIGAETVTDYKAPEGDDAAKVAAAMKKPPLCNYAGEGVQAITQEQWDKIPKCYKGSRHNVAADEKAGKHLLRYAMGAYLPEKRGAGDTARHTYHPVFISDAKVKLPPARDGSAPPALPAKRDRSVMVSEYAAPKRSLVPQADIAAMKAAAKGVAAVKVVAVAQLFPTPKAIADKMIDEAAIEPGMCVLEPSAGNGNLVRAVLDTVDTEVLAYEINQGLCAQLERTFPDYKLQVRCRDFLEVTDFAGQYPRVVMNPPFENGADIKHIRHAMTFLAPGGRLVALCAAGSRQKAFADELGASWEQLPAGSFADQGTNVNVAMIVVDA